MALVNIELPEFNISRVWKDNYIKLMSDARPLLRVKTSSYQLPVLPPSPPSTPAGYNQIRFADMVLRANDTSAIKLRLRRDNLYLVGFQMLVSGTWGTWMEFTPDTGAPQLIPGSTPLGFTSGYDALLAAAGVGGSLDKVNLGRKPLQQAVIELNDPNTTRSTRAKSLIVVLIMICESLRFTYITDFLAPTFVNADPSPTKTPNSRTVALLKNWDKLSELLLVREQSPTHYFPSNPLPKEMEIHNYLDAVAVLGILKEISTARSTMTLPTTIVNDDEQQYYPLGEPMVEVIWVKIDSVCDQLYGTIQVIDGAGSHYLYKTTRDESVKTKPGEQLILLKNPADDRSILAYDSFTINVDLKDAGNNNSPNSGVINGQISWNVFNTFSNVYDQPLEQVIKGECGSVTVNYVVLSDAVKAKLEVTLLIKGEDGGAETTHDVYGDLTARIGNFEEGSVIFKKDSKEPIRVTSGQHIPLLKPVVAVPLNSSLIIEANISPDDEFVKGTAEFPALLSGTSEKSISGKYGEIRVKVTWLKEM